MGLEIKVLSLIDIELDTSFLVLGKDMGVRVRVPTFGHLILGGDAPILVDTGAANPEIMRTTIQTRPRTPLCLSAADRHQA